MSRQYSTRFSYQQTRRDRSGPLEQAFTCRNCNMYVTCAPMIAGVQNRNHCPYCLWSRHLDLRVGGDRLSACRAKMQPVGLTTKRGRNKYASERDGELMLIHRCCICAKVVLNRIAADDDSVLLCDLFEQPSADSPMSAVELERLGIAMLTARDAELVRRRLFGNPSGERGAIHLTAD